MSQNPASPVSDPSDGTGQPFAYSRSGMPAAEAAARSATSPIVGIPTSDFLRDGIAALLLLLSLALPWGGDWEQPGAAAATRIDVLLLTLLSLASLSLPYLARAGVFPTWTAITVRRARLLVNAPYGLMCLVYIVLVVADVLPFLGPVFALGLAGVVLAAQPRAAEIAPPPYDAALSNAWRVAVLVAAGVSGLLALLSVVLVLLDDVNFSDGWSLVSRLLALLVAAALLTVPTLGVTRSRGDWALALGVTGGAVAVGWLCFSATELPLVSAASSESYLLLVPALGAIASSPAVLRTQHGGGVPLLFAAVQRCLDIMLVLAGYELVDVVLALLAGFVDASTIASLIILVIVVPALLVARSMLRSNPAAARTVVLGVVGSIAVGGLIILIVRARSYDEAWLLASQGALYFGFSVGVATLLLAPKPLRDHYAALRPARPAAWRSDWAGSSATTAGTEATLGAYPPPAAGPVPPSSGAQQSPAEQSSPPPDSLAEQPLPPLDSDVVPPRSHAPSPSTGQPAAPIDVTNHDDKPAEEQRNQ